MDTTKHERPQIWNIKAGKYRARFHHHIFLTGSRVRLVFKLLVNNPEDVDFVAFTAFACRGFKHLEYFLNDWFGKRVTQAEFRKKLSADGPSADLRAIVTIENKDWLGHNMPWIALRHIEPYSEKTVVSRTAELVLPGEICVKTNNRPKYNSNPPAGSYSAELTTVSEPSDTKIMFVFTMSDPPVIEQDKGSIYQTRISFFKPGAERGNGRDSLLEFLSRWLSKKEMTDCLACADWSATFLRKFKRKKVIITVAPRRQRLGQAIKPIADIVNIRGSVEGVPGGLNLVMPEDTYSPCPCGSGKKYKFCCYQK